MPLTTLRCASLPDFDAVIFDMDGLLLDSETLALDAMKDAAEALGLDMPVALRRQMIGVPDDVCRSLVAAHYGSVEPVEPLFAGAARLLEAAVAAGRLQRKPGVGAVLDQLDRLGLPRAVATSSGERRAHHHLDMAGLLPRLDAVLTRDNVARGKPHPDLYLAAARHLGIAPQRCLAFEDSYNGVHAAVAAGMPVVMVPDLLPATAEMQAVAVMVIGSLREILPCLAERSRASAPR
ncbi:MAG: HAD family hydrolase [Roseateles sp.]|uniref:HAD family hydrolase n=1 Tax=Roseateles sp. TaxID=1971397 RepID=UPI0040359704